jgi:hypothetical protein
MPHTWQQLLRSPNKDRWLKASNAEFVSLLGMQTWDLVPRPEKSCVIKSKWVFKVKRHPDQTIQKLKARLVAMGYSQIQGIDYDKVFSPTLRLETLCLLYSLMAIKSWTGRQVDFKTAFLNGDMDNPIFMEQPPGFANPRHPDYVQLLHKCLRISADFFFFCPRIFFFPPIFFPRISRPGSASLAEHSPVGPAVHTRRNRPITITWIQNHLEHVSLRDNTVAQKASTVPYSDSPQP